MDNNNGRDVGELGVPYIQNGNGILTTTKGKESPPTELFLMLKAFLNLAPGVEDYEKLKQRMGDNINPELRDKVLEYMKWDRNPTTRAVARRVIESQPAEVLSKMFENRLQFGTAGLRGKMGTGYNAMNDLVLIQTSQGLAKYLETEFPKEELARNGVVIGYDARHNSKRFAILVANAFVARGHKVRLFSRICPTPWIPFSVINYSCCCGIMVTASHNPKDDNGYKVYWKNSVQIIPPHDKGIQNSILKNLEPWSSAWTIDADSMCRSKKILDPFEEISGKYFVDALGGVLGSNRDRNLKSKSKLKFCYTAMHGVGTWYMQQAFQTAGLPALVLVEEQTDPDPDFPTVKFPNPEEGKSALNLAIQTANRSECRIILANDPDADRLAVAEKLSTGEWKIFNGNELGALLGWWCFTNYVERKGRGNLNDVHMISSTVSSKILQSMAKAEGFHFGETLTGFKWMANLADKLMEDGKTVLFAFEEAIGFMVGTAVLDKDGISAGVRMAELAVTLDERGLTLNDQLSKIYETYGYHTSRNSYYLCYDPQTITNLFNDIRSMGEQGGYPMQIMNGKYKVIRVRDLTTGFDSGEPDNKATLPTSKSSQMITFYFENGMVATLRTSGTEPKVKYYTELCASPTERDRNVVKQTLNNMVSAILEEWVRPSQWGLTLPPGEAETEEEREVRKA